MGFLERIIAFLNHRLSLYFKNKCTGWTTFSQASPSRNDADLSSLFMILQKQRAVLFITLLLQMPIMNCLLINRRTLLLFSISQLDNLACARPDGQHGSDIPKANRWPDRPCLCDVKIEVPRLFGFHVPASSQARGKGQHKGPCVNSCLWAARPSLSLIKSGRMPHRHRPCPAALCIDRSIRRCALWGADGYKTHVPWRFCWLGNFYAGL